jgi:hypothetical protein
MAAMVAVAVLGPTPLIVAVLATLAAMENRIDLLVKDRDVAVEITEQFMAVQRLPPAPALSVRFPDPTGFPEPNVGRNNALGNGETSIEQETSDLADHGGALRWRERCRGVAVLLLAIAIWLRRRRTLASLAAAPIAPAGDCAAKMKGQIAPC